MAGVKYHNALDENGRLISIKQAYLERNESHTYYCIGCGAEMSARLGEVRNWHFAHRVDDDGNCSPETQLHKLAKRLIREKFEKDASFMVGYYKDVKCSDMESCPFAKENECHVHKLEPFDLKEFYDTCKEEEPVGDFIADLLFTDSTKPDRKPLLIEIQVSHKSTPQKLDSGLHIIEIRLKTEEDIEKLLSAPIVENPDAQRQVRDVETIGYAKFYGFKRKASLPEPLELRSIQRFYLFRSGKAFVTNMDEFKSCRKVWTKDNDKAIFEASIDCFYLGSPSPYDFGYAAARQSGIDVKTCQLCKYHRSGFEGGFGLNPIFCCLYKKYGTPENPDVQYAKECGYYREDKALMEEIYNKMPPIVIASP